MLFQNKTTIYNLCPVIMCNGLLPLIISPYLFKYVFLLHLLGKNQISLLKGFNLCNRAIPVGSNHNHLVHLIHLQVIVLPCSITWCYDFSYFIIFLFIWGFTSLSTLYRSYHDG